VLNTEPRRCRASLFSFLPPRGGRCTSQACLSHIPQASLSVQHSTSAYPYPFTAYMTTISLPSRRSLHPGNSVLTACNDEDIAVVPGWA
jgi:hypothetical protein